MRTAYDVQDEESIPKPVLHIVRDLDGKHVDGHNRLRVEAEERERRLLEVEKLTAEHSEQFRSVARRTTDIQQLRFTPGMFAATVALCASIIGGSYASTWGLRDQQASTHADITEIKAMMASQAELRRSETKLADERAAAMAEAIKEIKARGEMTDLKVNNLRETVLTNQRR